MNPHTVVILEAGACMFLPSLDRELNGLLMMFNFCDHRQAALLHAFLPEE